MDAVAALLDGPRAREAFLLCTSMDPPWSLRIADEAPLTVVAVVRGDAWIVPSWDEPAVLVEAGGVAVLRGPAPYVVADAPDRPPSAVIGPDQVCTTLTGEPLADRWSRGVRTWGNADDGETLLLTGTYGLGGEVSRRLLLALPPLLTLAPHQWDCPVVPLLADEVVKDAPGQAAVLDRLLDVLLVAVLRAWFARPDADAPAWYRANADPIVGPALRLLHHNPAHAWTVASLAHEVGASRAMLARRFHELVGEPPMTYLTHWRIALAADLLREPGQTIASVAAQVGYGSPFALSTAFKRVRGVSPAQHRAA